MHRLMLNVCTASVLADLLDESIPYVWIRRHNPHPAIEWFHATVPISDHFDAAEYEVRSLEYELILPTKKFLEILPQFEDFGLALCQMNRKPPNTLWLPSIDESAHDRILIHNGMVCRFFLPHALETACFEAVDKETIDRVLLKPAIRRLVLKES